MATASLGRHVRSDGGHSRHDRWTSTSELRRQHSLQPAWAVWLARLRVPGEQPLAVLGRPDVGQGPAHAQERIRVPLPRLPVPRVGRGIGGGRVPFQSSRHGRIRRQRQQPRRRPAIRSRHSCSARFRARTRPSPSQPTFRRDVHGGVDQRRVQGVGQADADARPSLRLSVGPDRGQQSILDVRREHAESRRRESSRRDHLRGRRSGLAGTRTFENPPKDAWGPRIGAAYRVNDRSALRGGYGIYYAHVAFDQFVGQPTLGFQDNALAANTTNGIQPAFLSRSGLPGERAFNSRRSSTRRSAWGRRPLRWRKMD